MYASAVVITQALQSHSIDPSECDLFTTSEVHYICISNGIFVPEEDIVFKVATLMLKERHEWSYNNQNQ